MRPRASTGASSGALAGAVLVAGLCLSTETATAQEPIDEAMVARIKAEGLERSQAPALFHTLTDVLGPRLSGSLAYDEAARWARDLFAEWGLENAHLEAFEFGRGWSLESLTVEMVAPRYMPLIGYAEAWTPSTSGALQGAPVYVGNRTVEEIESLSGQLAGAIVLGSLPQSEFLREDRPQPAEGDGPVRTGNPPLPSASSNTPTQQLVPRLQSAGAGVLLRPGAMEHGTVRVQGNRNTLDDAVPSVVLAAEHYNMLVRLVEAGEPVELRVEVGTRYHEGDPNSYNVLAEIPGTDPVLRNEVVLIGAHLDSWHTGTGATDNGDGVAGVMEAMRILAALDARPRRTIRVALWGGEEQGLLGARAHVDRHLSDEAARDALAVYLNDDPGTGATYGFYMQGNEAAMEIFDAWLEPLRDLGVTRNVIEGIGSTDHVPFDQAGIPAFTAIKDFENYDVRTRHTNVDVADAVDVEELKQSAVVLASFAWHAAMRDEVIPRRPAVQSAAPSLPIETLRP